MLTVSLLLIVAAFICAVADALGKCPGWVATTLICVWGLLQVLPKG